MKRTSAERHLVLAASLFCPCAGFSVTCLQGGWHAAAQGYHNRSSAHRRQLPPYQHHKRSISSTTASSIAQQQQQQKKRHPPRRRPCRRFLLRNSLKRAAVTFLEWASFGRWAAAAGVALRIRRPLRTAALAGGTATAAICTAVSLFFAHDWWGLGLLSSAGATAILGGATAWQVVRPSIFAWPSVVAFSSITASWAHEKYGVRDPSVWAHVHPRKVNQTELDGLRKLIYSRSHGSRRIELVEAYKVELPPVVEERFASRRSRLAEEGRPAEPRFLFHGTPVGSAKKITASGGFRLGTSGMFGGGIYFAETPLKSLNYSRRSGSMRVILLCDVLLGRPRQLKSAMGDLDPQSDLFAAKRRLFRWGLIVYRELVPRVYDSVQAVPSKLLPFLSVRTPEFVVYREDQVAPRYILVVRKRF